MNTKLLNKIFKKSIDSYHIKDDVNQTLNNPYAENSFEALAFKKCWVDTVQWHLEDIIRDEEINPVKALEIKRTIDKSNQLRTDLVEHIDDEIFNQYKDIALKSNARLATETAGWAIDRLSILNLKIYHMKIEAERDNISSDLKEKNTNKFNILSQQLIELSKAIDTLFEDMKNGNVIAKTFKQMKMYNDPELNPILQKQNK